VRTLGQIVQEHLSGDVPSVSLDRNWVVVKGGDKLESSEFSAEIEPAASTEEAERGKSSFRSRRLPQSRAQNSILKPPPSFLTGLNVLPRPSIERATMITKSRT
jgi:hypothetical protein